MIRYLAIYYQFVKFSLMRWMEHRVDFLLRIFPATLSLLVSVVGVSFIYQDVTEISGWSKYELFLLLGTYNLVWGLFFGPLIHNLPRIVSYINRGELDHFLLKPLNSQFMISARHGVNFAEAAPAISGIALLYYALNQLGLSPSFTQWLLYALLVISSVVLAYALWLITMTTSFWVGRVSGLHEVFLSVFGMTEFPISVFARELRLIFTWIIPLAVLVMIPTQVLLGSVKPVLVLWSITAAVIFFFLSNRFWHFGLQDYASASS